MPQLTTHLLLLLLLATAAATTTLTTAAAASTPCTSDLPQWNASTPHYGGSCANLQADDPPCSYGCHAKYLPRSGTGGSYTCPGGVLTFTPAQPGGTALVCDRRTCDTSSIPSNSEAGYSNDCGPRLAYDDSCWLQCTAGYKNVVPAGHGPAADEPQELRCDSRTAEVVVVAYPPMKVCAPEPCTDGLRALAAPQFDDHNCSSLRTDESCDRACAHGFHAVEPAGSGHYSCPAGDLQAPANPLQCAPTMCPRLDPVAGGSVEYTVGWRSTPLGRAPSWERGDESRATLHCHSNHEPDSSRVAFDTVKCDIGTGWLWPLGSCRACAPTEWSAAGHGCTECRDGILGCSFCSYDNAATQPVCHACKDYDPHTEPVTEVVVVEADGPGATLTQRVVVCRRHPGMAVKTRIRLITDGISVDWTLFIRELAAYFHADPARFKVTGSTPAPMGGVVVVALWIAPAEDPVLALSAADIADRLTNGNTYPVTGMGGLNATTFPLLSTLEMTEEMRRKPPEERYQVVDPATETPPPDGTPQWLLPVLLVVLLVVLAAVVGGFVGCYCCCREKGDTDDSGNDNSGRLPQAANPHAVQPSTPVEVASGSDQSATIHVDADESAKKAERRLQLQALEMYNAAAAVRPPPAALQYRVGGTTASTGLPALPPVKRAGGGGGGGGRGVPFML